MHSDVALILKHHEPPTTKPEGKINMDNQHREKIKGYRELSQEEIIRINIIKEKSREIGNIVKMLRSTDDTDQRWVSIGATHLQEGFMALTRSVTKPEFF